MNLIDSWKSGRSRWMGAQNAALIPTWQLDQEAVSPHDVAKFARDGYERNSLIYSCIKEKATSFAPLRPQVVRRDGKVVVDHRMVKLLLDPNPHQDGQEFAETAATQFDASGNCYIWKVPVSDDPARQRAWATYPVQELRLIRPDLIAIEPGRRQAEDVYAVKVDGQVRQRIPRSQMIHIREPNLTNDFYGLPKIALLVREGAIDLSMSDFELAFFRNAGVPMGLLSISGRASPEEIQATKERFRKAYNGIKRWFELLVLNQDQATYTPMGIPQNQMEMDGSRYHVESRICSVFGVPGVIVGARYAMNSGSAFNYEDAEHSFWSETMVPFSMRFARAWKKSLLPEFATTQDDGADVNYDFTVVRALQEDRSRKLREVTRLINTGGFTVNQALTTVGMDPVDGGDFYVRNGNQVVVGLDGTITLMSEGGGQGKNPDNPLEGAARVRRLAPVGRAEDLDVDAVVAEAERLTVFRPREE